MKRDWTYLRWVIWCIGVGTSVLWALASTKFGGEFGTAVCSADAFVLLHWLCFSAAAPMILLKMIGVFSAFTVIVQVAVWTFKRCSRVFDMTSPSAPAESVSVPSQPPWRAPDRLTCVKSRAQFGLRSVQQ